MALWAMMLLMLFVILLFGFAQDVFDGLNEIRYEMLADLRDPPPWQAAPCAPFVSRQWFNQEAVRVQFREVPFMGRFTPSGEYVRPDAGPRDQCFESDGDAVRIRGGTREDISIRSFLGQVIGAFRGSGASGSNDIPTDALDYGVDCIIGGVMALTMASSRNRLADLIPHQAGAIGAGLACIAVSGMQELGEAITE